MLLNCGVREDFWGSLGLQGDPSNQSWRQSVLNIHWKNWCQRWSSNTLATWLEELTHWKRPWSWENWRQEEKGTIEDEMVGWHHWLAGHELEQTLGIGDGQGSLTCCSPWGHRVGHDWATELNWTDWHQIVGTSLAVQWLRSMHQLQGAWVRSLVRELKSYACAHTHTHKFTSWHWVVVPFFFF